MHAPERQSLADLVDEAQRALAICNACRYCEGYCAVFPALQRRLDFAEHDVHYLANLCHNCGACLSACQYAPPHEFQLNLPRTLAKVRARTYAKYAWPESFGRLYDRNGITVALALTLSLALILGVMGWQNAPGRFFAAHSDAAGSFYAVMSHGTMVSLFGAASLFVAAAFLAGFLRFWPDLGESVREFFTPLPAARAAHDALTLRYLDGGGEGCPPEADTVGRARRWLHHATFYGFLLCFAATSVATVYHYALGRPAPYPFWSLPVLLGTVGGIGLIVGPVGLLWLKARRNPDLADPAQKGMDAGFLMLLLLVSVSGLLLLAFRETGAMGSLLALHLGAVLAFFLTMPYGKFAHALYRLAALVRFHLERGRPSAAVASE
jgi:citrate/tricarballylate utilization protein